MKKLSLLIVLLFFINLNYAQESTGIDIVVTLENVLSDGGQIFAVLHNAETFMKSEGIDYVVAEGKKGPLNFSFKGIAPGNYAIMVMHDLNGNEQMDFDSNGLPVEHYCMSGQEMQMGPPAFDNAKFKVADKDLELSLRF